MLTSIISTNRTYLKNFMILLSVFFFMKMGVAIFNNYFLI